jgi:hypothetical protein
MPQHTAIRTRKRTRAADPRPAPTLSFAKLPTDTEYVPPMPLDAGAKAICGCQQSATINAPLVDSANRRDLGASVFELTT